MPGSIVTTSPGNEDLAALVERRGLVEIQPEAMAQVVNEAVLEQVGGARVEARRVPRLTDDVAGDPIRLARADPGPDGVRRAQLRLADDTVPSRRARQEARRRRTSA